MAKKMGSLVRKILSEVGRNEMRTSTLTKFRVGIRY